MNLLKLAAKHELFRYIKDNAAVGTIAGDSVPFYQFTTKQVEEMQSMQYEQVKANYLEHNITFESPEEAKNKVFLKLAGDELINRKNGIGTLLDPSMYTHSKLPIMFGPYESSAAYAPGGLPELIIDKKARAMVLQGATFKILDDEVWDNDKVNMLENAALETGFNDAIADANTESFIYGGSAIYPVFRKDTPSRYLRPLDKLGLEKGCIERWVTVDRWNTVFVPGWIVTAEDYLHPKTVMVPQAALEISTTRMAILKPKQVPYWIAMYNLGWAPSDFSGWIRTYYGYEITMQSIPVMAQQMSLLLYRMPLDALNATIGPDKVRELMKLNEEKMAEWSAVSPKAVNMVGEVEVVDRTYSGFEQFIGAMKSDLAAQCGIPEPSLWHTPNKGFSDNTTESLLKQSETLQLLQSYLERSISPCRDALIAHVFGQNSKEYENRNKIRISFDKPIISTEKDLAEAGARFAASVNSFVQAGMSPDTAIKLSSQFFPSVKITDEVLTAAKQSYEDALKMGMAPGQGGGVGNNMASSSGKTTGSFTKAK